MIDRLNEEQIRALLSVANGNLLKEIEVFSCLDSTNRYLIDFSKEHSYAPRASFAEEQTAGRGQRGRNWVSPRGDNIYLSLRWCAKCSLQDLSTIALVVAVALRRALLRYGAPEAIGFKWPNDLMYQDAKLAGILVDVVRNTEIVIGIGLNCQTPKDVDRAVTGLSEMLDKVIDRNQVAAFLLDELLNALAEFDQHGFQVFYAEWLQHDVMKNRPVKILTPSGESVGVSNGISDQGELLFKPENGEVQRIVSGEVSLRLC